MAEFKSTISSQNFDKALQGGLDYAADKSGIQEALAEKISVNEITLGRHSDGLVYIFVGGTPVGIGLDLSEKSEEPEINYGQPVVDNAVLSIAKGQTVQLGVKLSDEPTQEQTITVLTDNDALTFDKTVLTFTPGNWNVFQFVSVTAGDIDADTAARIILRNSDALLTETAITVFLTADGYAVDTTIPDGAHVCTVDDFETASATNSGANYRCLGAYTGEYTNIIVPAKMTVDGAQYDVLLKSATFTGNTTIQYVQLEDGVKVNSYGSGSLVTELSATFKGCTQLAGVKLCGDYFTTLNSTFENCTALKFVDGLEDQANCANMAAAFRGCTSLEYVQNISKLTAVAGTADASVGYDQTFRNCSSLKKIYGFPESFDSTCYWASIFDGCTMLESAVIPVNAVPRKYTFNKCTALKKVEIYNDNLTTSEITSNTFSGCSGVTVYCNAGTTSHESLLSVYGSSTKITIKTFGGDALPSVVVWGDSTTSPGVPWKCWPDRLQEKLGNGEYLVKNEAVSGEFTTSTSARQGGNAISVAAFTIPANVESIGVTMTSEDGQTFSSSPVFSCGGTFNPCTIADVEGVISTAGTVPQTYKFTRKTAGSAVNVPDGTAVVSKADSALNTENNVMIVELGNNAGWNENPSVLLNQMQLMVIHFTENGGTKYILFGPFSGQFMRQADKIEKVKAFETLAVEAFGEHFISIRQYLIENGLSDNGLEASALDVERMALGQIPASLIGGGTETDVKMYDGNTVTDDSHPNAYGANSIMLGIYSKGKALGYWE